MKKGIVIGILLGLALGGLFYYGQYMKLYKNYMIAVQLLRYAER
jgi:hypothetical protein